MQRRDKEEDADNLVDVSGQDLVVVEEDLCCVINSHSISCLFFDNVSHHSFLKSTMNWHKNVSEIVMNSMKCSIVHSDNCRNQHEHRENFNNMLTL